MILFLEGLPGVGKSTLISHLREKGVFCVDEVLHGDNPQSKDGDSQLFFMDNDDEKLRLAGESDAPLIVVDRGPISTLAYNLVQHKITRTHDIMPVVSWYSNIADIYARKDVRVVYLKGQSTLPYNDTKDPYGSLNNQRLLEGITLDLIDIYVRNGIVKAYDYRYGDEELINEILN